MLGSSYSLRPKRSRRPDHRQLFHNRIVGELPRPVIAQPHYPIFLERVGHHHNPVQSLVWSAVEITAD